MDYFPNKPPIQNELINISLPIPFSGPESLPPSPATMKDLTCWKILTRRKGLPPISPPTANGTASEGGSGSLGRVLSTADLTALGVGATLGVGVYVLAGHVSRDLAGPAVILSFLIAAVASFMAGLCYAEFGARVPKAGSAYYYSYVCIGEIVAFITGWNMILQYVIGSASISRGLSLYLDTIVNDTLKRTFREIAPIESTAFADYFDFLALCLPIVLAGKLAAQCTSAEGLLLTKQQAPIHEIMRLRA